MKCYYIENDSQLLPISPKDIIWVVAIHSVGPNNSFLIRKVMIFMMMMMMMIKQP